MTTVLIIHNPSVKESDPSPDDVALTRRLAGAGDYLAYRCLITSLSATIYGDLWEGFELDAKQNIVKVISGYRDAEHGLPQVTLYESRSGEELASYGVFSGVTIQ